MGFATRVGTKYKGSIDWDFREKQLVFFVKNLELKITTTMLSFQVAAAKIVFMSQVLKKSTA